MPDGQETADPQTLQDLLDAERLFRLMGVAGQRVEFWEAYCLLKADPEGVRGEIGRLTEQARELRPLAPGGPLMEKLQALRKDLGPLVFQLRRMMALLPEAADSSRMDLTIVFIVASTQGREAALRWVADPGAHREEAALRVRVMSGLVDAYRRRLMEAHIAAEPAALPPVPAPAAGEGGGGEASEPAGRGGDPMLGALRLGGRCREVLQGTNLRPEMWELVCLAASDGAGLAAAVRELRQLKRHGKPGEFAGAVCAFRQRLGLVRDQHGPWVGRLRGYAAGLNLAGWDPDVEGVVVGILAASPDGRRRVDRWLQSPRESLRLSASFLGGLVTRAIRALETFRRETGAGTGSEAE